MQQEVREENTGSRQQSSSLDGMLGQARTIIMKVVSEHGYGEKLLDGLSIRILSGE
jgi:hypothetical protein